MQAGSFPAVFVTAGLALVARRPRLAVALAAGGTATWLLAKVVKQVVDRGRPEALLHDVVVYGPSATGLGFPSGHAAVAALIMTVAAPYLTRRARVAGWVVVGLVAFTRVLIGAHFPLDALGGLLLGWTVGSVTNLLLGTPDGRRAGARTRARAGRTDAAAVAADRACRPLTTVRRATSGDAARAGALVSPRPSPQCHNGPLAAGRVLLTCSCRS